MKNRDVGFISSGNGYDAAALFRCTSIAAEAQDPAFSASIYRLFAIDEPCLADLCRRER